jgi:hypothetical protein
MLLEMIHDRVTRTFSESAGLGPFTIVILPPELAAPELSHTRAGRLNLPPLCRPLTRADWVPPD